MAKLSFLLVFALVLALPFHSVLGQDATWQSVIDQARLAGLSAETVSDAEKAINDGTAQKAAQDALGDAGSSGSLGDLVQKAGAMGISFGSPTTELEGDSPAEAPEDQPSDSPAGAPEEAPTNAPTEAPDSAPTNAPAEAPAGEPTEEPEEE